MFEKIHPLISKILNRPVPIKKLILTTLKGPMLSVSKFYFETLDWDSRLVPNGVNLLLPIGNLRY